MRRKEWPWWQAGLLLGLLNMAIFYTAYYLSASTTFSRAAGMLVGLIAPTHVAANTYWQQVKPIDVKTDKETISVHLGPGWYLENQDVIEPKDKVEVRGSRITFGGKPAIIASEVKKDDQVLKLRDEGGFPVWSGWWRR